MLPRARHPRGFTVIEAVVALTILAMVAGACLELRAQSLRQAQSIQKRHELARRADAVFELARAGQLGPGLLVDEDDPESGRLWTGERSGDRYRLVKETVLVDNPLHDPLLGSRAVYPERVAVRRYTLELAGETFITEWTQ
jgi:prepilin-type N-terminal cleavage/methylation domain-containing protein